MFHSPENTGLIDHESRHSAGPPSPSALQQTPKTPAARPLRRPYPGAPGTARRVACTPATRVCPAPVPAARKPNPAALLQQTMHDGRTDAPERISPADSAEEAEKTRTGHEIANACRVRIATVENLRNRYLLEGFKRALDHKRYAADSQAARERAGGPSHRPAPQAAPEVLLRLVVPPAGPERTAADGLPELPLVKRGTHCCRFRLGGCASHPTGILRQLQWPANCP